MPVRQGRDLRDDWCAGGGEVRYAELALTGHIGGALLGGPLAVNFLAGRFAGLPVLGACR